MSSKYCFHTAFILITWNSRKHLESHFTHNQQQTFKRAAKSQETNTILFIIWTSDEDIALSTTLPFGYVSQNITQNIQKWCIPWLSLTFYKHKVLHAGHIKCYMHARGRSIIFVWSVHEMFKAVATKHGQKVTPKDIQAS